VGCGTPAALLPELRRRAVTHLFSLDPLSDPGLRLEAIVAPRRLAPLAVHVYGVVGTAPLVSLAPGVRRSAEDWAASIATAPGGLDHAQGEANIVSRTIGEYVIDVRTDRPTAVVVREGASPGWSARRNGAAAPVLAAGHHLAVWVEAGHTRVHLRYAPPGLRGGLVLGALAAALLLAAVASPRGGGAQAPGGSTG
jgi:hypothetical protein